MDLTKTRLIAGAGGALLCFVGFLFVSAAAVAWLAEVWNLPGALCLVGGLALLLGGAMFVFMVQPALDTQKEMDKVEQASAESLASLPIDTAKAFVDKHPVTCLALAIYAGYAVAKEPESAGRTVQTMLRGLTL